MGVQPNDARSTGLPVDDALRRAGGDRPYADRPTFDIQVRWDRDNADRAPGHRNLVTNLTIGGRDLAAALEGDVRRKGYFEWHTWARKDHLSPGPWTVSVTDPDGQPVTCGPDAQPCRFLITVG